MPHASITTTSETASQNPLLLPWTSAFGLPPYATTETGHFAAAFDAALAQSVAETEALAVDPAPATFETTIRGLETSSELLSRVAAMFYGLASTDTTPEIQALERDLAPKLTAHSMRIFQDARLFRKVEAIDRDKAGLTDEQHEVLKRSLRGFVNAGSRLDSTGQARMAAIAERRSTLTTQFGQNVLKDEQDWALMLRAEADLAGLDAGLRTQAKVAAEHRGEPAAFAITLSRSSIVPFLEQSTRRDLRETAYRAFTARGANGGATDNRAILAEVMALRAEAARLLGHATFADMSLEFTMAKTPAAVTTLLDKVWAPAKAAALAERDLLQQAASAEGARDPIAAWDWRHYAEKVRVARFNLDEAELKPYLQLDFMIQAAFDCATRLFGLSFKAVQGLALNHPEARAWEVLDRGGQHVGLFIGDYFARPSKRSGAWMTYLRRQHRVGPAGAVTPIVTNTLNCAQPAPGTPALLSLDDAHTLFHEFGHALHGLLSNVTYPSVSGTSVARDFVELPSQLYEAWLTTPHVLKNFCRHVDTGLPMPDELVARMKAAKAFNMGFTTVEFLASAYVDMDLHLRGANAATAVDVEQVEADCLKRIGMPAEISMRHRPAHFQHIMGGYAAGYYSYLWSEVLDADAFRAFEEAGDVFDPATAKRLHDHIYSAGGKRDADDAYVAFRGRLPDVSALLAKRGFAKA
jgi:peptidyl-dipeptidase Dcp